MERKKMTVLTFQAKKERGEPITMLTAYDYPTALALEEAGIDAILVGDSLGMVVLGYETTLPVTMDDMIRHAQAVRRGAKTPLLIGDMPFLSYQADVAEAVRNAGRFLKESGMDAVKLEGGREMVATVRAITDSGIPVMGHIGLTPQSIHKLGGFRTQGKTAAAARRLIEDAEALQEAGCFSIVLESVPEPVARLVSQRLRIPTIGIGAGVGCDGQVLVTHDLLGLFDRFTPRFARRYAELAAEMQRAFRAFIADVQARSFPGPEHSTPMDEAEWAELLAGLEQPSSNGHKRVTRRPRAKAGS
jgi:3-methyl-2-oxobutanoate hydroxymethyltransferase